MKIRPEDALEYHSSAPAGKLSVTPTKPCRTQRDLSLAYTPGRRRPCLEIERDPSLAYKYTAKGNLVAVVTQRHRRPRAWATSAPLAGKPVMEGKARPLQALRRYRRVRYRAGHARIPTRSSAPASCSSRPSAASTWKTSRRPSASTSRKSCGSTMKIPVFHDDQHGTAIISGAACSTRWKSAARTSTRSRWSSTARARARFPAPSITSGSACAREHPDVRHQGRHLRGPHRGHEPVQGALRRRDRARARSTEALVGADVFFGLSSGGLRDAGDGDGRWRRIRSSSRWPIPIRRSPTRSRSPRGRTRSWPRAAPIIPTR